MKIKIPVLVYVILTFLAGAVYSQYQNVQDISYRLTPKASGDQNDDAVLFLKFNVEDRNSDFEANCTQPFSVFSNEQLILSDVVRFKWSLDSLNNALGFPAELTFFRTHHEPIRLSQFTMLPPDPLKPEPRVRIKSLNFAIVSGAILAIYFVFLISFFTRDTLEMLNLFKIFSFNFRDDWSDDIRSNSTASLLNYFFIIVFAGVILTLSIDQDTDNSGDYFLSGIKLIGLMIGLVLLRFGLIYLISWIFNIRNGIDFQLIGFFRLGLLISTIGGLIMLINFFSGTSWLPNWLLTTAITPVALSGYYSTLFIKLSRANGARPLHLFSYLCISEFIPLVLLVFTV